MTTFNFTSSLADEMTHFVKLKQSSGSDYSSSAIKLLRFDNHLKSLGFEDKGLTRPIFQSYFEELAHLCGRGFSNHFSVLRQFSVWLNQHEIHSYVPEERRAVDRSHSRPAYIFTRDEITTILQNSLDFSAREQLIPGLYCTLFSVLYSTGMRIDEALSLNHADYMKAEKLIHIREGKFRKERYLIISNSMADRLNEYSRIYESILTKEQDSPLFVNIRKKRLRYHSAFTALVKILKKSDIYKKGDQGPRLHDFRHTFAVHRLQLWYKTEKDINSKLPYLSTYMGHVNISSTQVYLEAPGELLKSSNKRFYRFFTKNIK